jgi:hypothetical protein
MTEMVSMSIGVHTLAIVLMLLLLLWMLKLLRSVGEFQPFSLKYEVLSLYYRALLATLFFTGIVVMAVAQFHVSWVAYGMLAVVLYMVGTSIKESLLYKQTRLKDVASQEAFKTYAKRKYMVDLIMIVLLSVVAYAVSLS